MIIDPILLCKAFPHFSGSLAEEVAILVSFDVIDKFCIDRVYACWNLVLIYRTVYPILLEFRLFSFSGLSPFLGNWTTHFRNLLFGWMVLIVTYTVDLRFRITGEFLVYPILPVCVSFPSCISVCYCRALLVYIVFRILVWTPLNLWDLVSSWDWVRYHLQVCRVEDLCFLSIFL